MPFTVNNNNVMPVLPKPENATGGLVDNNAPLSAIEDKELRKKLRNRQSALAARERKKARMLELERQVAELQEINRRMEDDNQYLRARLEVMARKCVRAGMRLDGEKDFIRTYNFSDQQESMRGPGVNDYSNAYAVNQQHHVPYPVQRDMGCTDNAHHQHHEVGTQAVERTDGVSTNEANLRNAIKVLGARQHEILQSMSYTGMHPHGRPVAAQRPNHGVHQLPVKQEYVETQLEQTQTTGYGQCNQITENLKDAPIRIERSREALGRIPQNGAMRGAAHKRSMTDLRRQALPSIGAMLASPAKRQCTEQGPYGHPQQELATHPAVRPISNEVQGDQIENLHPGVGLQFEHSQQEMQLRAIASAPELHNAEMRDCNLNSASSPMVLNAGDCLSDEFYGAADGKLPVLDFDDFITGDLSADSPTGLSGSDSGVSMDDSLDWIAENPIFDL